MNPFSPSPSPQLEDFERKLRQGARAMADGPSPELHGRILAAVRSTPRAPAIARPARRPRRFLAAAAAAVLVATGAWFFGPRDGTAVPGAPHRSSRDLVVASRGLFDAGSRVLRLPELAQDNLRNEAELLLADATRAAERIVGGLAKPLREPLRVR